MSSIARCSAISEDEQAVSIDVGRTAKVEHVGEAVGDDRQGVAGHRLGLDLRHVELGVGAVVQRGRADVDAHLLARQRGRRDAGVLQRLDGDLEKDALLRVHRGRFARGDAEVAWVEVERAGELACRERHRAAGGRPVGVEVLLRAETVFIHLRDNAAAALEDVPEFVEPICRREAAGRTHEGNLRYGHGHTQDPLVRPTGQLAGALRGCPPLLAGRFPRSFTLRSGKAKNA